MPMIVQHVHSLLPDIASQEQLILRKLGTQPLSASQLANAVLCGTIEDQATAAALIMPKHEDDRLHPGHAD